MNGNVRDLLLVARREVTTRMRGTAFRLSTAVLLACTVAGIAIPAALIGHPHRFTVAVTAQAPPGVAAMAGAGAKAAGIQLAVRSAAGRPAAVRLVVPDRSIWPGVMSSMASMSRSRSSGS